MRTLPGLAAVLTLGVVFAAPRFSPDQQGAALKLGEASPDFMLANIEGKTVRLSDYRGKKHVALVFYPALFRAGG